MNDELKKAIAEIDSVVNPAPQTISKSNEGETMDELLKTIRKLGKEGLKKALPNLSEEQKTLLNEVLDREILSKAKDMTKQAQMDDNKKPQKAQEPVTKEHSNSEEGVDEADEKLMSDSNKTQNHQGGPDEKPEGWQGEVVKSENSEEREEAKEKIMQMEEKEHGTKDPEKLVEDEKKEHAMEKGVPGVSDKKFDSCVEQVKQDKGADSAYAICTASLKKAEGEEELEKLEKSELLSKMVERMRKRGMHRGKCLEAMKKKGYDSDMADKLWDSQEKMTKSETAEEVVQKSIPWRNPQREALGARTHGRNATYSVSDELIKAEERRTELKKSNETFHDGISEPLQKSEGKLDINEIIAKGEDRDALKHAEALRTVQKSGAFTVSSFSDEEFLKAWSPKIAEGMKKLSNKPEKSDSEKDEAKAEKQESDEDKK